MTRSQLAILTVLLVLFAGVPIVTAQGSSGEPPGLDLNPRDFDPGDDGVSEGPLSGGGSGAGDPWPTRALDPRPIWIRDPQPQMHAATPREGLTLVAFERWDGSDYEIELALVQGERSLLVRLTDDRADDRAPRVVSSPGGAHGVIWESRLGELSLLRFVSVDPAAGRLGPARTLARLDAPVRAAVFALEDGRGPSVVLARTAADGSLDLGLALPGGALLPLARASRNALASLELRATREGALLLRWRESDGLEARLARDEAGRWGSVSYRPSAPSSRSSSKLYRPVR